MIYHIPGRPKCSVKELGSYTPRNGSKSWIRDLSASQSLLPPVLPWEAAEDSCCSPLENLDNTEAGVCDIRQRACTVVGSNSW